MNAPLLTRPARMLAVAILGFVGLLIVAGIIVTNAAMFLALTFGSAVFLLAPYALAHLIGA